MSPLYTFLPAAGGKCTFWTGYHWAGPRKPAQTVTYSPAKAWAGAKRKPNILTLIEKRKIPRTQLTNWSFLWKVGNDSPIRSGILQNPLLPHLPSTVLYGNGKAPHIHFKARKNCGGSSLGRLPAPMVNRLFSVLHRCYYPHATECSIWTVSERKTGRPDRTFKS